MVDRRTQEEMGSNLIKEPEECLRPALRRPATASESAWRVTVEEWEQLPGDPPAPDEIGPVIAVFPRWEQRLVYADEVLL